MAVTEKRNIQFYSKSGDISPIVRTYKMAASQGALMPMAPVELNASGLLELSDTDDTAILGFVVGTVNKATTWPLSAELAASTEVRVLVPRPTDYFLVYCDNNDSDSAVAQANVGIAYGIRVSSLSGAVGYVTMDLNETSNTLFRVVDIMSNVDPLKYTTSDNPGVALVKITGTLQG